MVFETNLSHVFNSLDHLHSDTFVPLLPKPLNVLIVKVQRVVVKQQSNQPGISGAELGLVKAGDPQRELTRTSINPESLRLHLKLHLLRISIRG